MCNFKMLHVLSRNKGVLISQDTFGSWLINFILIDANNEPKLRAKKYRET